MSCHILLFVNPKSGGHLGQCVIDRLQDNSNVTIIRLPEEANTWAETHADIITNQDIRFVAAGGDGTINWVVSLLTEHFGYHSENGRYRPPLAVIPFGSGNDMSRVLGWGSSCSSSDVNQIQTRYINKIIESTSISDVDIWQVKNTRTDTGETLEKNCINYFSLGMDARIAKEFADYRQSCGCCFCCPCMNMFHYFNVGLKNVCSSRSICDYMSVSIQNGGQNQSITNPHKHKTIVFQAIPSIYAGSDLWYSDMPHNQMRMFDKKIEVIAAGGPINLGLCHTGMHAAWPISQASGAHIETTEPTYFQIDGEGFITNGPSTFDLTLLGNYPLVFNQEVFDINAALEHTSLDQSTV